MPDWTPENAFGIPGVFDATVFDLEVFDSRFAFEPDVGVSGSWTAESAKNGTWTPEDPVS